MKGTVGSWRAEQTGTFCAPRDLELREIRRERVVWLREAITRGEYGVPAEVIAERLLVALFGRSN